MELTDFLLARIAEDEAECRKEIEDGYGGDQHESGWSSNRVLAECEAKRRIVENERLARAAAGSAPMSEQVSASDGPATAYWRGQSHALRLLALPYADHPDYRSEWRP